MLCYKILTKIIIILNIHTKCGNKNVIIKTNYQQNNIDKQQNKVQQKIEKKNYHYIALKIQT